MSLNEEKRKLLEAKKKAKEEASKAKKELKIRKKENEIFTKFVKNDIIAPYSSSKSNIVGEGDLYLEKVNNQYENIIGKVGEQYFCSMQDENGDTWIYVFKEIPQETISSQNLWPATEAYDVSMVQLNYFNRPLSYTVAKKIIKSSLYIRGGVWDNKQFYDLKKVKDEVDNGIKAMNDKNNKK